MKTCPIKMLPFLLVGGLVSSFGFFVVFCDLFFFFFFSGVTHGQVEAAVQITNSLCEDLKACF